MCLCVLNVSGKLIILSISNKIKSYMNPNTMIYTMKFIRSEINNIDLITDVFAVM